MRSIHLLGVPFNFGQDHLGVSGAYSFLKEKGLSEMLREIAPVKSDSTLRFWERTECQENEAIKYSQEASVASRLISHKIEHMPLNDDFLLSIGGDHGMALGTIHGILSHRPDSVIVWADAHGDINTPITSPSGNFHGMPLAFLLNQAKHHDFEWIRRFIRPEKLILIGPRDLDDGEKDIIQRLKIQYYSSDDLNRIGTKEVLDMALHRADPYSTCPIHLSFDVDVFDDKDFMSTGTRVQHGPRREEIFLMAGLLGETGRLQSMDVVEFNPTLGSEVERDNCAGLVMEFIEATLTEVFQRQHETHFSKAWNRFSKVINSYRAG
jgi:arginase